MKIFLVRGCGNLMKNGNEDIFRNKGSEKGNRQTVWFCRMFTVHLQVVIIALHNTCRTNILDNENNADKRRWQGEHYADVEDRTARRANESGNQSATRFKNERSPAFYVPR